MTVAAQHIGDTCLPLGSVANCGMLKNASGVLAKPCLCSASSVCARRSDEWWLCDGAYVRMCVSVCVCVCVVGMCSQHAQGRSLIHLEIDALMAEQLHQLVLVLGTNGIPHHRESQYFWESCASEIGVFFAFSGIRSFLTVDSVVTKFFFHLDNSIAFTQIDSVEGLILISQLPERAVLVLTEWNFLRIQLRLRLTVLTELRLILIIQLRLSLLGTHDDFTITNQLNFRGVHQSIEIHSAHSNLTLSIMGLHT